MKQKLGIYMLVMGCIGVGGCSRSEIQAPTKASGTTAFSLVEYRGGRLARSVDVASDATIFGDLVAYINLPGTTKGRPTITTYAPSLLIEADRIQVNIMRNEVVVSTRARVDDVWHPVVRPKSSDDLLIESKVREFLNALPSKESDGHQSG